MKRPFALGILFFANAILLLHSIIPHHHHDENQWTCANPVHHFFHPFSNNTTIPLTYFSHHCTDAEEERGVCHLNETFAKFGASFFFIAPSFSLLNNKPGETHYHFAIHHFLLFPENNQNPSSLRAPPMI